MSRRGVQAQCKDIPDILVLAIVDALETATQLPARRWSVENALWASHQIPPKLVNAKLRNLVTRGLLDGCAHCTCRGDFKVTAEGRKVGL